MKLYFFKLKKPNYHQYTYVVTFFDPYTEPTDQGFSFDKITHMIHRKSKFVFNRYDRYDLVKIITVNDDISDNEISKILMEIFPEELI